MKGPGRACSSRGAICDMVSTPSRGPICDIVRSPIRGPLGEGRPLRSVSLSTIPAGVLTPLKQLLRNYSSLVSGSRLRGPERRAGPDTRPRPGPDTRPGPAPGPDARPGPNTRPGPGPDTRPGPDPRPQLGPWPLRPPKRRAAEPPEQESPAKMFQRMKARAAQQRRAVSDALLSPAGGRHWPGSAPAGGSARQGRGEFHGPSATP